MSTYEFLAVMLLGFVIGWGAHSIILQIAYNRGIIEYRGTTAQHQGK